MEVSQAALDANKRAIAKQCADELRDGWQCRCLVEARGRLASVIVAILANEYAEHMQVLLRIAYPGFQDLALPMVIGIGVITDTGKVIAKVAKTKTRIDVEVIYDKEDDMLRDLRGLADKLKLNDNDRRMLFRVAQKWIALDKRVDHMGQKKAS